MAIFDNPQYRELYSDFMSGEPYRNGTDRISDLERISAIDGSFCIYSIARNGATSLMMDFARRRDGKYVTCQMFGSRELSTDILDQKLGPGNIPLMLDETSCLFHTLGSYNGAMDYLQVLSGTRQLGLRLSPLCEEYKDDISGRGFQIVEIRKIPYAEFKAIVVPKFERIDFLFPEELIVSAHFSHEALHNSLCDIAKSFRNLVENSR